MRIDFFGDSISAFDLLNWL